MCSVSTSVRHIPRRIGDPIEQHDATCSEHRELDGRTWDEYPVAS